MKVCIFFHLLFISIICSAQKYIAPPQFSHKHGFYEKPFSLLMHCDNDNTAIYYTTDGSIPTITNGKRYTAPITINKTSILRATAIADDHSNSETNTVTYLYIKDIVKQNNTPEGYPTEWGPYAKISGTAKADYEMDPEVTSDKERLKKIEEGFLSLPIVSLVTDKNHFFNKENNEVTGGIYIHTGAPKGNGYGRDWERPVSFEFFDGEDKHDLQINCGVKIHGGHSRLPEKSPKHSLRLVFREEFGPKKLNYPFFGPEGPTRFKAIVLRTAFCNSWTHHDNGQRKIAQYTRDMWAKHTQKAMGHLTTNGLYAHLFINGIYWGMYNPTERIDDDFCEAHCGGDKEDYDVIKVEEYDSNHTVEAGDGTLDKWNDLVTSVSEATDMTTYLRLQGMNAEGLPDESIEPLLDAANLIDYMIINQYGGNSDWDNHNWLAIRNRIEANEGFKFICWDSEHILKNLSDNVLSMNNAKSPSYLFQELMKNKLFKRLFIDHVQKHCFNNGILTPERAVDTWNNLHDIIKTALYDESARWGDYRRDVHAYIKKGELYLKETFYEAQREFMLNTYFPERTDAYIKQLRNKGWFPNIDAPVFEINNQSTVANDTLQPDDGIVLKGDGKIYYTLNGDMPISWMKSNNGIPAENAILYDGELIMPTKRNFTLKAVCLKNGEWSATHQQNFIVPEHIVDGINIAIQSDFHLTFHPSQGNHDCTITFSLQQDGLITLELLNLQGSYSLPVTKDYKKAGKHTISLSLQHGIYLCRLTANGVSSAIKIVK